GPNSPAPPVEHRPADLNRPDQPVGHRDRDLRVWLYRADLLYLDGELERSGARLYVGGVPQLCAAVRHRAIPDRYPQYDRLYGRIHHHMSGDWAAARIVARHAY